MYIENRTKIIVTTIQKFSFILDKVNKLKKRNYAIIIDEAHSSQTGEHSKKMQKGLRGEEDQEDAILKEVSKLDNRENLSFFAFTATPKKETLRMFGKKNESTGKYEPFHVYSMQQAIDEGFIQNVLSHYTTYKTFFSIRGRSIEDPLLQSSEAKKQIYQLANSDDSLIEMKVNIMLSHFWYHTRKKMNGKAKAMVVTESRKQAGIYKLEFEKQMKQKSYDNVKIIVAFSGEIEINGQKYTEESMNGFKESELTSKFNDDEYRILIVANKYQTGFDQPLLHTMYVDKMLHDINAVQTLSRLNRNHYLKEDTFILDFKNNLEDIQKSFEKFCSITKTNYDVDSNYLYNLKKEILSFNVFSEEEVVSFNEDFKKEQGSHSKMNHFIQIAKERFDKLEDEQKNSFKAKLSTYNKSYSFVTQLLSLSDRKLKEFQSYGKVLYNYLNVKVITKFKISELIEIEKLRVVKTGEHFNPDINTPEDKGSKQGTGGNSTKKVSPLSEIIQEINEQFDILLNDDKYQEFFQYVLDKANEEEIVINRARNNDFKSFYYDTKDFQDMYNGVVADGFLEEEGLSENVIEVSKELQDNDELSKSVVYRLASFFYESVHKMFGN